MNTGDRIKQRRLELGLTADDLAEKIGKSRATIYRYENGDIENMPTPVLEPLAKALDTTPADLMGWQSSSISPLHNNIRCENVAESELVLSYRKLNKPNQSKVLTYSKSLLSAQQMEEDVLAAHARTDVEQTPEGVQHDLDIMNDDSEWEQKGDFYYDVSIYDT